MAGFRPILLKNSLQNLNNIKLCKSSTYTYKNMSTKKKLLFAGLGILTGGAAVGLYALDQSVKASELVLHPPSLPWYHKGFLHTFDHASIRRGFEVYKQVCSACHSLEYIKFRHLVGVSHTEAEMKAIAAEYEIEDGPNDEGNMFMRPGKLNDKIPNPYPNEEAAKFANGGANPPDLSYMALAREGGEDYLFALLTGYCDPPAGFALGEGLHYNPYFPGQAIGMAQALYNEAIEYEDGTPATASQMAKDVATFLAFTADIHHDERKSMIIKTAFIGTLASIFFFLVFKRYDLSYKTRKMFLRPKS